MPLWPQYSHCAEKSGDFIRFASREPWLINFILASRRSILRGDEPQRHGDKDKAEKDKPIARALVRSSAKY